MRTMLAEVWCTTSLAEADLLCAHLRHFDIESRVQNATAYWAIGLPCSAIPFVLVVAGDDADPARELVRRAWAAWSGRAGPAPGEPEKLSCSDLFDITAEEDNRLARAIRRERKRNLLLWWAAIVVGHSETLICWLLLQPILALARRLGRGKSSTSGLPHLP